MMFKCSARSLMPLVILLGAGSSAARGEDPFGDRVLPFLKTYCVECHDPTLKEGELDLTRYTSASLIAQDFRQWEHVVTFLKEEKMPPKKSKQPPAAERAGLLAAVDELLLEEARKLGNDPGATLPRRLSNAEYDYTIRDLTGFDIRPTSSFPVDPASGEGFNNTGEALTMSPSLFKKYYGAAQQVADHALLTTSGLEFAPFPVVTFADQQKFYEQAIIRFYEQHKVDYESYFTAAWSFGHRPKSRESVAVETWALENNLSPRYLRLLWDALRVDASTNVFYMQWLRQPLQCLAAADRSGTRSRPRGNSAPDPSRWPATSAVWANCCALPKRKPSFAMPATGRFSTSIAARWWRRAGTSSIQPGCCRPSACKAN